MPCNEVTDEEKRHRHTIELLIKLTNLIWSTILILTLFFLKGNNFIKNNQLHKQASPGCKTQLDQHFTTQPLHDHRTRNHRI